MVTFGFDLEQGLAFTIDLEFDDIDEFIHFYGQVNASLVGYILGNEVKTQAGDIGVDDAGIIALVAADGVDPIYLLPRFLYKALKGASLVQCSRYGTSGDDSTIPFTYTFTYLSFVSIPLE